MAKKKNKLLEAARQAAQKQYNNTPRQSNSGVTQSMIDNEIKRRDTYAQSQKATAPTAVRGGSGSLGAITKYKATGDPNMYYVDEKRASERMKERGSSSTYNPFQAGSNTRYGAQSSLQKQAEEKQRHGYDVKLKDKTSAGRRRTYSNLDGTQGTYYEKDRFDNPARTTFLLNAVPSRVSNQMMKNPAAKVDTTLARGAKRNTGISLDPSQFMTQESANTLKYDDGKRIEYYERQGNQWVSVPEERYFQTQLLDNGRNPAMYSAADRALDTAKSSWENLKASAGGVLTSTDVGRENKGYQLAVEYMGGGVLSPKQEEFMRSTKAGQAVLKGDVRTARELVNQETRERQISEQGVLEQQQRANERAEVAKIGAGKGGQFLLDLERTGLDMAPGMALNAVMPGAFLTEMAFQSYGNSYNNARLQGASHDEAVLSGLQNAAVETLSEMMFAGGKALGRATGVRGIFHPGREIEEASLGFIKSTAGRDIVTTVKKLGLASAEEGAEELVAGLVEPMLDAMIYQGGLENLDWEQTLHDALYNTLVGAAMGGGFGTVDVAQSIAAGSNIRANADVANMINQGLAMPEDSKAYMIARKLDAQYKADPDTLGNIDVSELNRALQEEWQNVQKTHSKEMSTARAALAREGISNLDTHAEEDYVRSRRTDAQDDVTAEEAAYSHSELGDRFGATYEQASEMIRASGAEMSQIETERAAASIARIMYGEGTAADTANLMASNPVAREVFQEISGKALPADNAGAMRELEKFNTTNKIRYATEAAKINQEQDRKRRMSYVMEDARNLLGRSNPAVDTFHGIAKDTETENLDAAEEAFIRLYDLGNSGAAFVPNLEMAGMLPEEAQRAAYYAGAYARARGFEDAKADLARADAKSKEEGKKTKKGENDVQQKLDEEEAKTAKKEGYTKVAQELQKALGVKIVLETKRSIAGRDLSVNASLVNGWYSNGVIHLNMEGVDPMEVVFSHEFTHHLERYAPKEYQALIDFIKQEKTNNNEQAWQREIDAKMEQYARAGKKLKSRDDAVREIVADMAYEFLTDERTVHRLFGYDKNLATKIQQTILDVIDKMLKVLRDETRIRGTQWEGMQKQFEEAREMWIAAAEVARGNADLDIKGSMQFELATEKEVLDFLDEAQANKGKTSKGYNTLRVDYIPERIVEEMEALSGKTIDGNIIGLNGYDIYHEFNSHSDASIEASRSQVALDRQSIIDVVDTMMHPEHLEYAFPAGRVIKRDTYIFASSKNRMIVVVGCVGGRKNPTISPVMFFHFSSDRWNQITSAGGTFTESIANIDSKFRTALEEANKKGQVTVWQPAQNGQLQTPKAQARSPYPITTIIQEEEEDNDNTQKEQGPFSLADIGMTEKNGRAAWLPERIDDLMQRYGGTGNYSQAWAVMMNPRDFLKLTLSDDQLDRWSSSAQNVPGEVQGMPYREAVDRVWNRAKETGEWIHDNENYPLDQNELASNEQTPFISIYEDSAGRIHVDGHEGRHRMRALMEAGITSVPVVVKDLSTKYSKTNIDSMTLGSQDFGRGPVNSNASVTVTDLVPIRRDNRDELMAKFGAKGDEQVQFSLAEDSEGRKLSKGQQEYFKNSKARDEQGRLVPVYHSTEYGGFTVFDPNASDDGRSLFFTSNRNMSESYTKKKGTEINPYEVGNQTPLEEAYDLDEAIERLREVEERGIAYVEVRVPANEEEADRRNHYAEIMHPGPDEILLDYMTLSDYLTDYPLSEFPDGPEGMRLMVRDSKTDWVHADMRNLSDLAEGYNDYVADYNFDSNVDPYESRGIQGTYSSYLNLENPLIIDAAGQRWDSFSNNGVTIRSYIVQEDENGREGVTLFLYDDEYDGGEFYTFEELKNRFSVPQNEIDSMLDEGHGEIGLRNNQYYDLEENGFPEMGNTRSWSEYAAENGYDGVIIRNLHDNGVYGVSNEAGDVYIAFSSNQVKDIRNENPTDGPDIRFSISDEQREELNDLGVDTTEGGTAVKYSLASWNDTDKEKLIEALVNAGHDQNAARKWVNDVNTIAAIILGDMERLNYEADQFQDALKNNEEYYYTLDLSTLCQKRRLYQGTYNAIMHQIVNRGLMPQDTVRLREMMKEMGFEAPCGICYEESRKKNEGKFAERWLEKYNSESHDDPYQPTLADVTTTDGRAALRENHPEIHDSYLAYQRTRGSANPKVSFTHTDYRQDILRMTDSDVRKVKHIGGLRIQSFSDFETIHVIDMMQAVLDMATKNLTAQAYTKVPAFADIFGGTGIKINLSLIGQVKDGELWFDPVEGIDPDEAFRIREKYSDNVGTILVGANTESILAAWKDPRIDMVIPFHRSGWSKSEFEKLGLGDYEDFQAYQSERYLDGSSPDGVALSKVKMEGIYPSDYWDYSKTGKENAEAYLRLCAEKHYRPVFYNFLQDNGDGTWSLKDDGSTDGYWKSLIDYKMYNNEGVGAPQREVWPNFDMEVAEQTMAQYEGNADTLPVAQEVVDRFLEEYKAANPDVRFSLSEDTEGRALTAAQQSFFKDSKIRDEQGRLKVMYHGTDNEFTVFNFDQGGKNGTAEGFGIYTADDRNVSENYGGRMIEGYVNMTRPAYRDQKTITRSELKKLIKATIDYEVGLWEMDERDSWISNYTDTYSAGSMDTAINDVVAQIVRFNDNDMDIVQEVMAGMAIREYPQAEAFYDILTDVTGIDGFVTNWTDHTTGESSQIALAFRSNQIKNVTNENPTEDPDIRYSIQSTSEGGNDTQLSLASDRDMEIANLRKKVERLQRDKRRTYGREANDADARRVARALLADTSSDFSLNQTIKAVKELFTMIKRGDDFADIYGYVQGIARSIADSSYDMVEIPGASDLADLRQRFLDTRKRQNGSPLKIMIPQNLIGDFDRVGGWKEFRAAHKGIVTLSVNSGESYDSFVEGIAEEFGEQYRVEGDNSGIDSLIAIIEAADSQEARNPVRKTYRDEDAEGSVPDDVDMGVMGGWRDTEVNSIIDRLLDDVAEQIAPDLTFADRKAEEKDAAVKKERAKWEARREKWRVDRDKRIAEMKEDKKLAIEAQRAKGEERLRKQAEFYRRQREKSRERRADRESRRKTLARIYKTTQRLSQKLLKPTDSQHVPEKYRKAVADVLGWLDFENARTDAWARRHGDVPSARILNLRKLKDIYAEIANDESLNQYIEPDDQIKEWIDLLSDVEGARLDDLTTEQLRTVRLILDAVSWQVNNADKALTEGLKQSRADMATELMDELEAQKGEKLSDGVLKKFIKADSTPVHFFDRLGLKVFKRLWQQLTIAQDTHIRHLSEAQEYIKKNITSKWGNTAKVGNNSLIKKWTEESEKYELENGKTVEMTGAQVMSLYALNKREQARKHLLGGGIVIAPTKVKRDLKGGVKEYLLNRELQKTRAELTYKDIANILSKMSQEQKDAADAMLKYLKTTSEWGNETSMKLYGYRKFTEENYFPIQSAKEFIAGSNLELQRDKKIKNQGMTKSVNEYANNPIVIDDFFEVTTAHINQMSQYNSFVPILEDFDKIYQYSEYDPETQKYHRSVKELIEQKHGRWAADYIETLLKNVNGNYGNEVADIQGFDKLLRNWKAAKIGLSVRVLAQQPTAVVRAFNEIDPKYFVGTPRRGSHKRMWEICPIAEWKNWGYSQTDIHRSMRDTMMGDKHLTDKLFFDMYGKADNFGWGVIFDAVERETKDLMRKGRLKFEFDSAEYRQHVNERFRQVVDRTQVVDSVLHRSQLMRSQNTLTKAMTSFMAEPTITVNTIMTAFSKAQEEARAGHKGAAAKAATRGITVFVANAVAVSAAASLVSAIRESYLPDDDDDEEKELSAIQQWLVGHGVEEGSLLYSWMTGYFIEDFKDNINPLMLVPVTKDMLNMLQGYEAPNPMYQLPQSLIKNVQNIKQWVKEDGDTRYSGRYYIERAAESVAELFGVPASNIRKELIGLQNIYFRAISEKEYGDYLQDRWELNEDYKSNKNIFLDHYLNAKKAGHDESARDIREQLLKSKVKDDEGNLVFTDEAIQKRAWSVYAPNFKDDVIAGRDVSKQEKDLKSVGITAEDIDDKKSKALVSSISDAVEMGDTNRLEDLYGVLEKYGYGEYDVDKKVKSAASDLMYDAIDAENYDDAENYITIITDVTGYTRDDVVSSITTHYMSSYYDAMDAGDQAGVSRVTGILGRYGVTSNAIHEKEAEHYKDYYRQKAYMAYSSGNTAEAYRIATEYNAKYPGTYAKGADGMMYGLQNLSPETIRRYNTSGKYAEWQLP